MRLRHVVVVPSSIAFLPCYAGLEDPLRDVRHAARRAVDWLVERHPEQLSVLAADPRADNVARGASESPGERVARHLLSEAGFSGQLSEAASGLLVVANGTAKRNEKAPGHLDERAAAYDKSLGTALLAGDAPTLRGLDTALGEELWAFDAPVLRELGRRAGMVSGIEPELDYADDPYGVQYWVVRWTCTS